MKRLQSYVEGRWQTAETGFVPLVDPCSEEPIAEASSNGIDFGAALQFTRSQGGAALRELSIAGRAELLDRMSKVLYEARSELIELSLTNTGATRKDAKFDIDGATYTLAHYAGLGKSIGEGHCFVDGDGTQLGRSPRYWGQHLELPLHGAAVHINAFNFPAWGIAEKAACAILAGMPVIAKPATSSALVAARCVEVIVEAGILPDGALSLICGSTGDLLEHLGPQDVLAFTGSAATALKLRGMKTLLASSTRVNVEADSLNAVVLGADVQVASDTWDVFVRDVVREITQKSGQKCTAVRRVLVPRERLEAVTEQFVDRLAAVVVGNPRDGSVTMGPLATAGQLRDAVAGVAELRGVAELVHGAGERVDGVGNPAGKGYFFSPTLLRVEDGGESSRIDDLEVFAPVATLIPYDGTSRAAAAVVARGGGSLVTSIYSNDLDFLRAYLAEGGSASGRLYVGSEKVAGQLPGSGVVMPQLLHGGPGRAGGGAELGGLRGLSLYLQRVAVSGDRALVERLGGVRD